MKKKKKIDCQKVNPLSFYPKKKQLDQFMFDNFINTLDCLAFFNQVFGGFWYFFSFQRVTSCWHRAICLDEYKNDQICANGIHSCDIISDSRANITILLNEKCPINPPNATAFDFGIFLQALESGVHSSDDFFQKFLNCFWWGLQNLRLFELT